MTVHMSRREESHVTTKILDISPVVSTRIAVFPGDTPFSVRGSLDLAAGDPVNLTSLCTTPHLGAHADSPWHFHRDGVDMAGVDLEAYWGPALVIHCPVSRGSRVMPADAMPRIEAHPRRSGEWRCLVATGTFPDPEHWNADFAALSPELIEALHARGCVLVGIDTPSVDPQDSKDLPTHQALYRTGMRNLEGLTLLHAPEGWYEMVALPLRLEGLDGSPVRAALRQLVG